MAFGFLHSGGHWLVLHLMGSAFWEVSAGLTVAWFLSGQSLNWLNKKVPVTTGFEGRVLHPYAAFKRYYNAMRRRGEPTYTFGGLQLPGVQCCQNIMYIGGIGSGKTISLRFLLASILKRVTPDSGQKVIIYDAKRDMLEIIRGMNADCPVWILNCFDRRHTRIDLAKDINTPALARSLAKTLLPQTHLAKDPFWIQITQLMLEGLTLYFIMHAPGRWTLRDLLIGTESLEVLQKILKDDPKTEGYLTPLQGDRLTHSVMCSIQTYLGPFKTVAALWEHATSSISLSDFLQQEGVLLLPRDEVCDTAVEALNRVILMRLSEMVLNGPEVSDPHCWVVLDEFCNIGAIPKFKALATNGRSKGVSIITAFQSFSDLCDTYGRDTAHTLTENFWYKAIFRVNGQETAEFASRLFGNVERVKRLCEDGHTLTQGDQLETAPAVLAGTLLDVDAPNKAMKQGITGYYLGHYGYEMTLSSRHISRRLPPKAEEVKNFEPFPDAYQYLQPWTAEDYERLNIRHLFEDPLDDEDPLGSLPTLPPDLFSGLPFPTNNQTEAA